MSSGKWQSFCLGLNVLTWEFRIPISGKEMVFKYIRWGPGPSCITPDQLDPHAKDQLVNALLVYNFALTVTNLSEMWEGLSLTHATKFGNCRGKMSQNCRGNIVNGSEVILILNDVIQTITTPLEPYHWVNSLYPERYDSNLKSITSKLIFRSAAWALMVKLLSCECHRTSLIGSQHWFR